jgi:hypothetical protein
MHDNYDGHRLEILDKGLTDSLKHKTNPKFEARNPKQCSKALNFKLIYRMNLQSSNNNLKETKC